MFLVEMAGIERDPIPGEAGCPKATEQVQSTEEGHGVEGWSGHVTHKETGPGEDTPRPVGMECSRERSEIFIPGSIWQRQPDQASQGTQLSAAWLKQCLGCGLGLGVGSEVPLKAEVLTTHPGAPDPGHAGRGQVLMWGWRSTENCEPGQRARAGSVLPGWGTDHCTDRTCADTPGGHRQGCPVGSR